MKNILTDYFKGRGAQFNPHNKFIKNSYVQEFPEVIDEPILQKKTLKLFIPTQKPLLIN